MMLIYHCDKNRLRKENFLAECIIRSGNNCDKTDLLCEIFGVEKHFISKENI